MKRIKSEMDQLVYTLFGSPEGVDIDLVVYCTSKQLASLHKGLVWCKEIEAFYKTYIKNPLNITLAVVSNGIVIKTLKGSCNETNNGLLLTYHLHTQPHPLYIT